MSALCSSPQQEIQCTPSLPTRQDTVALQYFEEMVMLWIFTKKKNRREVNNQILMQAIKLFWMFMKFSWLIDWKGWQSFSQLITFEAHQFYIYEAQVNAPLNKKLCESIFKFSGKDIANRGRRLLCHSNENINRFKRHHHSKTK